MPSPAPDRRTAAELADTKARTVAMLSPAQLEAVTSSIRELVEQGAGSTALARGQEAPDFILPDASGQVHRLHTQLAKGPVVLVFFRGGWCGFCETYLRGLQRALPEIRAQGTELIAVSPQLPDKALNQCSDQALSFPLVSDVGLSTTRRYGLVFTVPKSLLKTYRQLGIHLEDFNGTEAPDQLPLAATFVIGPDHRIARAQVNEDYTQRYDPADIVAALAKLK